MGREFRSRGPAILGVPPLHFAGWVAIGLLLEMIMPPVFMSAHSIMVGWGLMVLGVAMNLWSVQTFHQARTSLHVRRAAETMVTGGPYRYSRNPLYLSMLTSIVGYAFIVEAFWLAAVVPLIVLYVNKVMVEPEEFYLENCFGDQYLEYKRAVRRWL